MYSINQRKAGLYLSYINTILSTAIGFFLSVFLIRKLGETEYGVYQSMGAFANYLVLLEFGVGTVMTRNIAVCRAKNSDELELNKTFTTIISTSLIVSVLMLIASVIFYYYIHVIYAKSMTLEQIAYGKRIFLILSGYLIISFLIEAFNGVLVGFENFIVARSFMIAKLLLRTATIMLIFIWIQSGLFLAVIDFVISVVYLMILLVFGKQKYKLCFHISYFDKAIFKSIIPYAGALMLQSLVNQANNSILNFLVSIMMNPAAVTVFSIAMFVYSTFSTFSTIPISVYLPKVVMDVKCGVIGNELADTLIEPCRSIVFVGGAILFGFAAIGKEFVTIFYGAEYITAYYVAVIFMIPMFVNMATGILINVLDALGKRMTRSLILLGSTAVAICLAVVFIQWFGLIGAALSSAFCTLIGQVIIMNLYYHRQLKINILRLYKKVFAGVLPSLLITFAFTLALVLILPATILIILVECLTFVLIFVGACWILGFNNEEKSAIKNALDKFRNRISR